MPMKIAIALSGGADSLMSLLVLRKTGAEVMGVHARFLPGDDGGLSGRLGALCAGLGVDFHVLDLRHEFEDLVVTPFISAYQAGLTPNPCASCNPTIKFGLLLDRVLDLGAHGLATGHYSRLEHSPHGPVLFRGHDPAKDQSYFLSRVPRERFAVVHFPLAAWTKTEVRTVLAAHGITPPAGRESQEICFIPKDYRMFLHDRKIQLGGPGPIVLSNGTILGTHRGLWNHTPGQRKGLGIAYSEPLYVLAKNIRLNQLIVGTKSETTVAACRTGVPNLLCSPDAWPTETLVQTIYRQRPVPAHVDVDERGMTITFSEPHPLPAPGQVAAVYSAAGQVLAGAIIESGASHAA